MAEWEPSRRRIFLWMRALFLSAGGTAALAFSAVAIAGAGAGPPAPPIAVSCADAIYVAGSAVPRPVQAVTAGPVVFNSLAHLTTPRSLERPQKELPFFVVKSPTTVLASAGRTVVMTLVRGGQNVRLLYGRKWLKRLSSWHYRLAEVPASVRLETCRDKKNRSLTTQYAGGFLLHKPGCITLEVRVSGEKRKHRASIRLGVPHC
jgi:hypothetical protein